MKDYLFTCAVFAAVCIFLGCVSNTPKEESKPKKAVSVVKPDDGMCVVYVKDAMMRLGSCNNERLFVYAICKMDDAIRSTSIAKKYCGREYLAEKFEEALTGMYEARLVLVEANSKYREIDRMGVELFQDGVSDFSLLVDLDNYYKDEGSYPISPAEVLYMNEYYEETNRNVNRCIRKLESIYEQLQ